MTDQPNTITPAEVVALVEFRIANRVYTHASFTVAECRAIAALIESPPMPWNRPELEGWSICGMNHYHVAGVRHLFVSMARGQQCIKAESAIERNVFASLAAQATALGERSDE